MDSLLTDAATIDDTLALYTGSAQPIPAIICRAYTGLEYTMESCGGFSCDQRADLQAAQAGLQTIVAPHHKTDSHGQSSTALLRRSAARILGAHGSDGTPELFRKAKGKAHKADAVHDCHDSVPVERPPKPAELIPA